MPTPHGFACKTLNFPYPAAPALARPECPHAPALKAPHEAGRCGGESIARQVLLISRLKWLPPKIF
ncbi:hypothetical protein DQZ30_08895 [Salmonella enterica subsp. diarizonae]|nr:hypothetical protein [Salmonella enterica]ECI4529084.1 hypothetical protein [Salmonella enterica subsp. diarizonae]EDJ7302656.1 hypothetical protein [Salmonella enterica]